MSENIADFAPTQRHDTHPPEKQATPLRWQARGNLLIPTDVFMLRLPALLLHFMTLPSIRQWSSMPMSVGSIGTTSRLW